MMETESPIFVTGFSRGGANVLMNLLASHPEVCTVGEIHSVFRGSSVLDSAWQIISKAITRDLPHILASGQDLVSPRNWSPRAPIAERTQEFIRRVLRRAKLNSSNDLNLYKAPNARYTDHEREHARLVGTNLDNMALLSDAMIQMYPEAEFVGLIRNGFAVCEAHVRRGCKAQEVGRLYRMVVEKMLRDQQRSPNYHVVKFDELVQKPVRLLKHLFVRIGLNPFQLEHVHVQHPNSLDENNSSPVPENLEWMTLNDLPRFFDSEIDERQIRRLRPDDRQAFLREAGDVMERLGYQGSISSPEERLDQVAEVA